MTRWQITNHFGRHALAHKIQSALTALFTAGKARSEMRLTGGRAAEVWIAI